MSKYTPEQVDLRNLIHADLQFEHRGETDLKIDELQALVARGWMQEGDENNEFDVTDTGRSAIATTLRQQAERGDGAVSDEVVERLKHRAKWLADITHHTLADLSPNEYERIHRFAIELNDDIEAVAPLLRAPAEQGGRVFVYPEKPKPRAWGYLDDSGVEWAGYDVSQMEAYARAAVALHGLPESPLDVFSKGSWTYSKTGEVFDSATLDEVAFAAYRKFDALAQNTQGEAVAWRFFITDDALLNPFWTGWSSDENFRSLVEKRGYEKAEYAFPGQAHAERASVPDGLLQLIRDARHRICNDAPNGLGKRPFDDPVYGPLLRRLDAMDAQLAAPSRPEDAGQ